MKLPVKLPVKLNENCGININVWIRSLLYALSDIPSSPKTENRQWHGRMGRHYLVYVLKHLQFSLRTHFTLYCNTKRKSNSRILDHTFCRKRFRIAGSAKNDFYLRPHKINSLFLILSNLKSDARVRITILYFIFFYISS